MARGFLAGAVTGGLVGAVALAGLSLLTPLPQVDQGGLSVGLPVGSEFGRGGDIAPTLPAPGAASLRDVRPPAVVPVPQDEPAPMAITDDNTRPEAQASDRMPAQSLPAMGEAAPGLTLPEDAPVAATASTPQPAPDAGQDALPQIAPDSAATPNAAPALSVPTLDLSLPPDLTDLRRLERN